MTAVTPIQRLERRLPTAGRLRFGDKSGNRGAPKALDKWRATSRDQTAIEQLAAVYGGTPRPWKGAPGRERQWEVYTDTSELSVLLPPNPLGDGPIYELWSGGGCLRRCDGESCETSQQGPDGAESVMVPCICAAQDDLECSVKTRLQVILPDVRFSGVWRLDTGSWYAAHELPGMVDMIVQLQEQGRITRALLRLEVESKPGKNYVVPKLGLASTADELAAGAATVGALAQGNRVVSVARALDSGEPRGEWFDEDAASGPDPTADDDVVDAEIVEDASEDHAACTPHDSCTEIGVHSFDGPDAPSRKQLAKLHILQTQTSDGDPWPAELEMSDGQYRALLSGKWGVRSSTELSKRQVSEAIDAFSDPAKRRAALQWLEKRGS